MMLKKKNVVAMTIAAGLAFSAAASAMTDGAYVGGTIGYGNVHEDNFENNTVGTITSKGSKDTGLAGGFLGGYQFTQNIAAELGYTRFHNATAHATTVTDSSSLSASGNIQTQAIDLVAKGILPLQQGFNVFGKLGVSYLMAKESDNATLTVAGSPTVAGSGSKNYHNFYPTFGVGVGYDVCKNVMADVSYNRIQKVGSSSNNLPSTDYVGAGLSYSFG